MTPVGGAGGAAVVHPLAPGRARVTDRSGRTVADAMVTVVRTCPPDATVDDARRLFADDHVHAALIVGDGVLLAVVERPDLVGVFGGRAAWTGRLDSRTIAPDADLETVRLSLLAARRRRLAVVAPDGRLLGLLCLKRDGSGFCSDRDVTARQRAVTMGA